MLEGHHPGGRGPNCDKSTIGNINISPTQSKVAWSGLGSLGLHSEIQDYQGLSTSFLSLVNLGSEQWA